MLEVGSEFHREDDLKVWSLESGVLSPEKTWTAIRIPTPQSLSGKEVLSSHSHRGFSPVIQLPNRIEEPFQRFLVGSLSNGEVEFWKEVLSSHSHRGFSPVIQLPNRIEEPFQRFLVGSLSNGEVEFWALMKCGGKVFAQERASATKKTVETVRGCSSGPGHAL